MVDINADIEYLNDREKLAVQYVPKEKENINRLFNYLRGNAKAVAKIAEEIEAKGGVLSAVDYDLVLEVQKSMQALNEENDPIGSSTSSLPIIFDEFPEIATFHLMHLKAYWRGTEPEAIAADMAMVCDLDAA